MSDLSRLLGDVYRTVPAPPPEDDTTTDEETEEETAVAEAGEDEARPSTLSGALPEWADESVLDEAFSNWVPGPPSDAPQAERGMLSDLAAGPTQAERAVLSDPPPPPVDDRTASLAEAVPDAPDFLFPQAEAEPVGGLVAPIPGHWQRSDDDLLPGKGRARSFRRK